MSSRPTGGDAPAGPVELRPPADDETLEALLRVAVEGASPEEVMPPVAGPPGWTVARRDAFLAWHRARRAGLDGPLREITFAVVHDGGIAGSARLARRSGPDVLETGLWLARSARGRGIGTATLGALVHEAARLGARALVAGTRTHNVAALTALRRNGADLSTDERSGDVFAVLTLPPAPPEPRG